MPEIQQRYSHSQAIAGRSEREQKLAFEGWESRVPQESSRYGRAEHIGLQQHNSDNCPQTTIAPNLARVPNGGDRRNSQKRPPRPGAFASLIHCKALAIMYNTAEAAIKQSLVRILAPPLRSKQHHASQSLLPPFSSR